MRFEDTPDLFGGGSGMGTSGRFRCQMCGGVYNAEADEEGRLPSGVYGETVVWTDFAGFGACEDCFEAIETAILARLPTLLPWLARVIASRKEQVRVHEQSIREVLAACDAADC